MNQKQILNLFVPAIVAATTAMAAKWGIDPATWGADVAEWSAALLSAILLLVNHFSHTTPGAGGSSSGGVQCFLPFALLGGMLALATGCTSIVNDPQGKVVSVTTRVFGVDISMTDTTTQTPSVKIGFVSQNVTLEPTSTNGPIYSPNFANTFGDTSTSLLDWGIDESLASGNYETLSPGGTNSAATSLPVTPK